MRLWEFTCMDCGCKWYMEPKENEGRPGVNYCPKCGRTVGEWLDTPDLEFKS
jgi:NAD-dependent SIR2 family protein deacetylase